MQPCFRRSYARYTWHGRQPTRCRCCSTVPRPTFTLVDKSYLSPEACRFPFYHCSHILARLFRQWLSLELCTSRLVEALCLVCSVRCTYSLSPALGVVRAPLIPTCPRICVCSMYLMALVASCGSPRIALRLCRLERWSKMRFWRSL